MGASEEEEIMEDIAAGEMDSGDIDLESQAEEDVEESLDEDMGMGGMDLNVGNGA
jgi:hypothetical protein